MSPLPQTMSPLGADRGMSNIPKKKGEKNKRSHHFHFPLQSEKAENKRCVVDLKFISRILKFLINQYLNFRKHLPISIIKIQ